MSKRSSLSTLTLIALFSWGGLLWFTYAVPPGSFPAFVVFFLILAVALTCTATPIAYLTGWILPSTQPTLRSAIRQGTLIALIVVLNLMLCALSSWNVFTAILILVAVVVVEVVVLARK
jgi:hypothetical protein